jgi:hypothetical protein
MNKKSEVTNKALKIWEEHDIFDAFDYVYSAAVEDAIKLVETYTFPDSKTLVEAETLIERLRTLPTKY